MCFHFSPLSCNFIAETGSFSLPVVNPPTILLSELSLKATCCTAVSYLWLPSLSFVTVGNCVLKHSMENLRNKQFRSWNWKPFWETWWKSHGILFHSFPVHPPCICGLLVSNFPGYQTDCQGIAAFILNQPLFNHCPQTMLTIEAYQIKWRAENACFDKMCLNRKKKHSTGLGTVSGFRLLFWTPQPMGKGNY